MTTPAVLYDNLPARVIEPSKQVEEEENTSAAADGSHGSDAVYAQLTPSAPAFLENTVEYETILEEPNESDYVVVDPDGVIEAEHVHEMQDEVQGAREANGKSALLQYLKGRSKKVKGFVKRKSARAWRRGISVLKNTSGRLHDDVLEPTVFGMSQTYSWLSDTLTDTLSSQLSAVSSSQSSERIVFPRRIVDIGEPLVCNVILEEPDESCAGRSSTTTTSDETAIAEADERLIVPAAPTLYDIETDADVFDYHIVKEQDCRTDMDEPAFERSTHQSARRRFFDLTNHQPEVLAQIVLHAALTGGFLVADTTWEHSARAFLASQTLLDSAQRKWAVLKETSPLAAETSSVIQRGYDWVTSPLFALLPSTATSPDDAATETRTDTIEMGTRNHSDVTNNVSHAVQLTQ